MAISILYGPGGAGKSFYQMHIVVRQLRETRRNVVTNLAIEMGELQSYLERKYPGESHDVVGRIRILTREEAHHFWDFRGPLRMLPDTSPDAAPLAFVYEEDKGQHGVCYIIDEAGAAGFNAIGWAAQDGRSKRGEVASWYLDQQRKFGDDVYASTNGKVPTGIAKPFRDKAHDFTRLRNGYQATYGVFRARGRFTATHFQVEPSDKTEPYKKESFELDVAGLAKCYRTQDGMGVQGINADKGTRAKGIHVFWVFPLLAVVGASIVFVPWLLGKGIGHAYTKNVQSKVASLHPEQTQSLKAKGLDSPSVSGATASRLEFCGVTQSGQDVAVLIRGEGWQRAFGRAPGGGFVLMDGRVAWPEPYQPVKQTPVDLVKQRDGASG